MTENIQNADNSGRNKFFKYLDVFLAVFLICFIFVFLFWVNITTVNGISMAKTYKTGDMLLINIINKDFNRGDIITVYQDNKDVGFPVANSINTIYQAKFKSDPRTILVKRIVGLPGEEIEMKDKRIIIYNSQNPNGYFLEEATAKIDWRCNDYASNLATSFSRTKIPQGKYFAMGDNRGCSQDSRFYGSFNKEAILGKVIYKVN